MLLVAIILALLSSWFVKRYARDEDGRLPSLSDPNGIKSRLILLPSLIFLIVVLMQRHASGEYAHSRYFLTMIIIVLGYYAFRWLNSMDKK